MIYCDWYMIKMMSMVEGLYITSEKKNVYPYDYTIGGDDG